MILKIMKILSTINLIKIKRKLQQKLKINNFKRKKYNFKKKTQIKINKNLIKNNLIKFNKN